MQSSENIKNILHTKQVSRDSIRVVRPSNFGVQHFSRQHTGTGWRGNGIKPISIGALQLGACLSLHNLPFK